MTMIDDGEAAEASAQLVGRMFLSMLATLDRDGLLAPSSEAKNVGLVMALYLSWASGLPQYGLLERDSPARGTKKSASKGFKFDPVRIVDYIATYAEKAGIKLEGVHRISDCLDDAEDDADMPKKDAKDPWGWRKALNEYKKERAGCFSHGGTPSNNIGGDTLDITTWTPAQRKKHAFKKKDPLGKKELDAIKNGMVMQLG